LTQQTAESLSVHDPFAIHTGEGTRGGKSLRSITPSSGMTGMTPTSIFADCDGEMCRSGSSRAKRSFTFPCSRSKKKRSQNMLKDK
jgi:hypothetical protein